MQHGVCLSRADGRIWIMRDWAVGGGIITSGDSLLMVHNRRRNGQTDWTTPGGVIDPGETMLEGLTREVTEETGLVVASWDGPVYSVVAVAADMDWTLTVEVYRSQMHEGELIIDDPDGIVFDARWVATHEIAELIEGQQRWFAEPLQGYLADTGQGQQAGTGTSAGTSAGPATGTSAGTSAGPATGTSAGTSTGTHPKFSYRVSGTSRENLHVERLA